MMQLMSLSVERTSFADMHCSLARTLERIGDWWSPLILRDLFLGVRRFDELVEDLGISRNLLTRRLAALIEAGIVRRDAYQQRPKRYEYRLTEAGDDLAPILMALTAWGDRWARPAAGKPIEFVHESCGKTFVPQIVCPHCRDEVRADEVRAIPGPGGAATPGTRVVARLLSRRPA